MDFGETRCCVDQCGVWWLNRSRSSPLSSTSPKRDACKHDQIVADPPFQGYESLTRKDLKIWLLRLSLQGKHKPRHRSRCQHFRFLLKSRAHARLGSGDLFNLSLSKASNREAPAHLKTSTQPPILVSLPNPLFLAP